MTGDESKFGEVAVPHLADGFALARWITGNNVDAEDVVQEASLRAFRGIQGYAGGNARAWFLTIVRNTAYSWLRKNRPAEIISIGDLETLEYRATEQSGGNDGSSLASPERIDFIELQSAIMSLPAAFRETLILRELHGLDYREIASVTAVPVGTVMSRLARARRRLFDELTRDE